MDVQIRGRDIQVTDGLRTFIERRTQKLDPLLDRVLDAKLELRADHDHMATAQLTIQTGRQILRAEERDRDPRKAVAMVVDTMAAQIRRHRNKRADRKWARPEVAPELAAPAAVAVLDETEDEDEGIPPELVRTKRFAVKPMDPEEAIEQMELLGHDFFLFLN